MRYADERYEWEPDTGAQDEHPDENYGIALEEHRVFDDSDLRLVDMESDLLQRALEYGHRNGLWR